MPPLCTFIIPTLGRETLSATLKSIAEQTDPDWNALVVGDGLGGNWRPPWHHARIWSSVVYPKVGWGNAGGALRNHGMAHANGTWFCFVDDDDRVDVNYVKWLREEAEGKDLFVFHMRYGDGSVLPPPNTTSLVGGKVGISFAIRAQYQREHDLWFIPSTEEDWTFLNSAIKLGAVGRLSDKIAYYVRS